MNNRGITKWKKQGSGLLIASPFLLPSLIGLIIFSLMPLIISGLISLTDWNGLDQLLAPGMFAEQRRRNSKKR